MLLDQLQSIPTQPEAYIISTTIRSVAIKIDDDIKVRLKRLAEARQRTSHKLMREAITQYVDREEKQESFCQDTLKAWEAYRTTRLHVTAEEAHAWLAKLEQGSDIDPPECHV